MRILVVDDEPLNRFLLIHMLEENGLKECYEAESGEQALKLAEEITPDIVLLDVVMPGLSGHDVAPRLKKMQKDTYLPIIFITALDDEESLAKCLSVGGDDFVAKPFNKVILAAKLKAHARTRLLSKRAKEQNTQLLFHQQHIEREHAIVERIFSNVLTLNRRLTKFVDHHLAPASNFNGDVLLIERSPNAGFYILLGDFTGHGLASAIGAIPITRAFQTMAEKGISVGEIAATFNETLLAFLPGGMFFAAAVIEVSESGKAIDIWNGGLPHLMLVSKEGKVTQRFESQHMALGILDPEDFEKDIQRYEGEYGDRLFGYTDGVIELTSTSGEMLGEDGLEFWLESKPGITTDEIMEKIEQFHGGAEQADDITMFSYEFQELGLSKQITHLPKVPFKIQLRLDVDELREGDPVSQVIDMISGHTAFHGIRSNVFTVVSELYTNALDHGLLKLDSKLKESPDGFLEYFNVRETRLLALQQGWIEICACYQVEPAAITFTVKDSGDGFDYENIDSQADSDDNFGRGVALVAELADSLQYSESGTKVMAKFLIENGVEATKDDVVKDCC